MKTNMSTTDRIIRLLVAGVLLVLFYTGTLTGTWGYISIFVAVIFLLTSVVGFCPIYSLLGIHSNKRVAGGHK